MIATDSIWPKIRASKFVRDTMILSGGTAIGHSITFAVMPVLSRLYPPAHFGLLALFASISGIVATALTLRYETSIPLTKSADQARQLIRLCMFLTLVLGTTSVMLACVLPPAIRHAIGVSALGPWFPAAIVSGMVASFIATVNYWFVRAGAFKQISKIRIVQGASIALLGLVMGITGTEGGLMIAQLVGQVIPMVLAVGVISLGLSVKSGMRELREVAHAHVDAPKFLLPASLLDNVTQQLPVFLIAAWFSQHEVGQFSLAWKVLLVPMVLVGGAIGQVFYQRFSQAWPDRIAAQRLLFRTWGILLLVGAMPTTILMLFGEPLFSWTFGKEWQAAGKMASILAPMLLALFVSSPTSTSYLVLNMQRWSLVFGLLSLVYRPGAFLLGVSLGSLYAGLVALSFAEIMQILFYNWLILKKIGFFR